METKTERMNIGVKKKSIISWTYIIEEKGSSYEKADYLSPDPTLL